MGSFILKLHRFSYLAAFAEDLQTILLLNFSPRLHPLCCPTKPAKCEAKHFYYGFARQKDLIAFALFDQEAIALPNAIRRVPFHKHYWRKREIRKVLTSSASDNLAFVEAILATNACPLFEVHESS